MHAKSFQTARLANLCQLSCSSIFNTRALDIEKCVYTSSIAHVNTIIDNMLAHPTIFSPCGAIDNFKGQPCDVIHHAIIPCEHAQRWLQSFLQTDTKKLYSQRSFSKISENSPQDSVHINVVHIRLKASQPLFECTCPQTFF